MSLDDCSIQHLIAQLRTAHFQSYLLTRGWVETPSGQTGQRRFELGMSDDDGVYEMYLPAANDGAKYRTRLLRNIYKLCGIEDREPAEIAREMVTSPLATGPPAVLGGGTKLRLQNSGSTPLRVTVGSPAREVTLYANEAIELIVAADGESVEIERTDNALAIRTTPQG